MVGPESVPMPRRPIIMAFRAGILSSANSRNHEAWTDISSKHAPTPIKKREKVRSTKKTHDWAQYAPMRAIDIDTPAWKSVVARATDNGSKYLSMEGPKNAAAIRPAGCPA